MVRLQNMTNVAAAFCQPPRLTKKSKSRKITSSMKKVMSRSAVNSVVVDVPSPLPVSLSRQRSSSSNNKTVPTTPIDPMPADVENDVVMILDGNQHRTTTHPPTPRTPPPSRPRPQHHPPPPPPPPAQNNPQPAESESETTDSDVEILDSSEWAVASQQQRMSSFSPLTRMTRPKQSDKTIDTSNIVTLLDSDSNNKQSSSSRTLLLQEKNTETEGEIENIPWDSDAVKDENGVPMTESSLGLLMNWLTTKGNYNLFYGKPERVQSEWFCCGQIQSLIANTLGTSRLLGDIKFKIHDLNQQFNLAHYSKESATRSNFKFYDRLLSIIIMEQSSSGTQHSHTGLSKLTENSAFLPSTVRTLKEEDVEAEMLRTDTDDDSIYVDQSCNDQDDLPDKGQKAANKNVLGDAITALLTENRNDDHVREQKQQAAPLQAEDRKHNEGSAVERHYASLEAFQEAELTLKKNKFDRDEEREHKRMEWERIRMKWEQKRMEWDEQKRRMEQMQEYLQFRKCGYSRAVLLKLFPYMTWIEDP